MIPQNTEHLTLQLPDGSSLSVPPDTEVQTLLNQQRIPTPYPVVGAKLNNSIVALTHPIQKSGTLFPVDLGSIDGALIARRTLTFILCVAAKETFPLLNLRISHSLDHGYYVQFYLKGEERRNGEEIRLSPSDVRHLEMAMHSLVEARHPIHRRVMERIQAIELFRENGMQEKAELLAQVTKERVSVYVLKGQVNHFYGLLAPSTDRVSAFELRHLAGGVNLRFARTSNPLEVPPSRPGKKIFAVLEEYDDWMHIINFRTVRQLNRIILEDKAKDYIMIAEALQEKKLANIAEEIRNHPRKPRVVLLSGPSASGKTTSTKRLGIQLRVLGLQPVLIEMDNFFVERERTPKDQHGEYDFESFDAIDRAHLQECVRRLLQGEQVQIPKFNFKKGMPEPGETLQLPRNGILILEGIHGLNDQLLPTIPDGMTYKIYASPMTHLSIDDHNRISSADARLLRRLVRDIEARGHSPLETIRRWPSVRRGEEKHIFPYQENADVVFNSALAYEIAALKPYAEKALGMINEAQPEWSEAQRLLSFLSYFKPITLSCIPHHSLLREFIGGSCFSY
jgi:uridine kinase